MHIAYTNKNSFVLLSEVAPPHKLYLQHLDKLMDGVLGVDGHDEVLLEPFPCLLVVEEEHYWYKFAEWIRIYTSNFEI